MPLFIQLKYTDIHFLFSLQRFPKKKRKVKGHPQFPRPAPYAWPKFYVWTKLTTSCVTLKIHPALIRRLAANQFSSSPPTRPTGTFPLAPQSIIILLLSGLPAFSQLTDDPALHVKLTHAHTQLRGRKSCVLNEEEYWRERGRSKRRLGMDAESTHDSKTCVRAGGWRD